MACLAGTTEYKQAVGDSRQTVGRVAMTSGFRVRVAHKSGKRIKMSKCRLDLGYFNLKR